MLKKIVSGGQTGVDQAALAVALEFGLEHGGWCPKGRKSELGVGTIPFYYALSETESPEYEERTKLNIRDSDATLIFVPSLPLKVTDGTVLTIEEVQRLKKPYLIVDLSVYSVPREIVDWIKRQRVEIKTLNIAGPRESQCPGIYGRCKTTVLPEILRLLQADPQKHQETSEEFSPL